MNTPTARAVRIGEFGSVEVLRLSRIPYEYDTFGELEVAIVGFARAVTGGSRCPGDGVPLPVQLLCESSRPAGGSEHLLFRVVE